MSSISRARGSIGRDKAYRLLVDLMNRGYIIRRQVRDAESKQFGVYEYVVYDEPQRALKKKESRFLKIRKRQNYKNGAAS